jgi:DNA-binding LacI/PurR family transcriptional regulator
MGRVTIKDIALAAKVSPMTVSNVVNGRQSKASMETVERINEAIQKLGYRPNLSARSLASKSSRLIGIVVPFTENQNALLLDNPFYAEMVSGIESALRSRGYYMMLSGLSGTAGELDALSQWNVDALIAVGIYREGLFEQLRQRNLPTLLVDSYVSDGHFYHLGVADENAAFKATRHLIDRGHQRIGLVSGAIRAAGVMERRLTGYRRALDESGLLFDPELVLSGSVTFDWGVEAAGELLTRKGVTAVFCTADLIAAGLLTGLHRAGIDVPDQISVMGFDNLPISRMVYPALSTIDQSILEKGRLAGNLIVDVLEKRRPARETLIDVDVLERDSVRDPRQ